MHLAVPMATIKIFGQKTPGGIFRISHLNQNKASYMVFKIYARSSNLADHRKRNFVHYEGVIEEFKTFSTQI